jgi:hypothetical protein
MQRRRQVDAVNRESHSRSLWRGRAARSLAAVPLGYFEAAMHPKGPKHVRDPGTSQSPASNDDHNLLHRVGGSLPSLLWRASLLAGEGRACRSTVARASVVDGPRIGAMHTCALASAAAGEGRRDPKPRTRSRLHVLAAYADRSGVEGHLLKRGTAAVFRPTDMTLFEAERIQLAQLLLQDNVHPLRYISSCITLHCEQLMFALQTKEQQVTQLTLVTSCLLPPHSTLQRPGPFALFS